MPVFIIEIHKCENISGFEFPEKKKKHLICRYRLTWIIILIEANSRASQYIIIKIHLFSLLRKRTNTKKNRTSLSISAECVSVLCNNNSISGKRSHSRYLIIRVRKIWIKHLIMIRPCANDEKQQKIINNAVPLNRIMMILSSWYSFRLKQRAKKKEEIRRNMNKMFVIKRRL